MSWYRKAQLDRVYTKQDMVSMGADGHLANAVLVRIPVNRISGREPTPATYVDKAGREQEFRKGTRVTAPVEVEYNPADGSFTLYGGNHRLRQAEVNGDRDIPAFVGAQGDDLSELSKILSEFG